MATVFDIPQAGNSRADSYHLAVALVAQQSLFIPLEWRDAVGMHGLDHGYHGGLEGAG